MEKYSKWRVSFRTLAEARVPLISGAQDPATGIAPFLVPLPASTETLPPALKLLAAPLAWTLALIRTALAVLLLALQWVVVELVLSVYVSRARGLEGCKLDTGSDAQLFAQLVVPPVHAILSRVVNALLPRAILLLLGFVWIQVETVSLKRTA
jgi:hypothetical protein